MCHIIFFIPFLSLGLFYVLPFHQALALSLAINALSFFLYYLIIKVMRRKPECGKVAMVGREATVLEDIRSIGKVLIGNEIWYAGSEEKLKAGQRCIVTAFDGLTAWVSSVASHHQGHGTEKKVHCSRPL